MVERRSCPRQRTYLGGTVVFNTRASALDCVVRNLSEGGAKLRLGHDLPVPQDAELLVPRRERSGRIEVVWRAGAEIGVKFVGEATSNVVPLHVARRLREAETAERRLRQRIAELTGD